MLLVEAIRVRVRNPQKTLVYATRIIFLAHRPLTALILRGKAQSIPQGLRDPLILYSRDDPSLVTIFSDHGLNFTAPGAYNVMHQDSPKTWPAIIKSFG
jgi:hypothetical protein